VEAQTQLVSSFTYLYSCARGIAIKPRNIKSGWSNAGLCAFNPERVLKNLQKPQREDPDHQETAVHTVVNVGCSPLDHVPQTPVTTEALKILRCQIEKDILLLPGPASLRLHKSANTAERSFADSALLLDQNRLLVDQNNEKRVRQLTKSTVIGRAKIMSYEDIEALRKRDAKEVDGERKAASKTKRKAPTLTTTARKKS